MISKAPLKSTNFRGALSEWGDSNARSLEPKPMSEPSCRPLAPSLALSGTPAVSLWNSFALFVSDAAFVFWDLCWMKFCILKVLPTGFASNSGWILPQKTAQKLRRINNEISPGATYLHSGNGKCVCGRKNSLKKCADKEKTRSFFVISPSGIVLDRKSQCPHCLDTTHWAQSLLQLTTFEI